MENHDEDATHPLVTRRLALEKLRSDRNLQEGDHQGSQGGRNSRRGSFASSVGWASGRKMSAGGSVKWAQGPGEVEGGDAGHPVKKHRQLLAVTVQSEGGSIIRDDDAHRSPSRDDDHGDDEMDDGYSEADRKLVEESDLMYRSHMVLEDRWMSNVLDIIIAMNCGVMGQDQVMIDPSKSHPGHQMLGTLSSAYLAKSRAEMFHSEMYLHIRQYRCASVCDRHRSTLMFVPLSRKPRASQPTCAP